VTDERARIAEELRRIREGVRERALHDPHPLPSPREIHLPEVPPAGKETPPEPAPRRPDATALNACWDVREGPRPGLRGLLSTLFGRIRRGLEAQTSFNARQVQLDNEILAYIDARLDLTHRHYDSVLGRYGRHMGEIDERHLILQEELVAHVHDLVKRIDLVLEEAERGRLSLECALKDIRHRVAQLEERILRG
jgi:hypothetical protein